MEETAGVKKRRLTKPRIVIIIICSVILAGLIVYGIVYLVQMNAANKMAEDTIDRYLVEMEAEPDNSFKIDWNGMWEVNPNVVAWLQVPAIPEINYPVVLYSDNDYYLRRSWTGEPLNAGCIMEDYHCAGDFSDFHTILYGHNMTYGDMAGTMFGQLKKYQDQEFYDENDDQIIIYIPDATLYYTIFSVQVVDPGDPYVYLVGDFTRGEAFDLAETLRETTEVETGVWADGDDRILTLSTCSGTGSTKRLAVHAKLTERIDGSTYSNEGVMAGEI